MGDQKAEIEAVLEQFWDEMAIDGGEDPTNTSGLVGAPLDSLTAVEVLLQIDTLVQRKLPADLLIQKGGYASKDDFVKHLTSAVLGYLQEHPDD
ncbi:hypothetical protein [Pseudoxanthomonas suwonensis]|uniref:hypothetical protein n=1 Tax=Pseudoxanthomonas suwonensis TaxID=314722 RepID=UPI00138F2FEF|nr:hypothetical protein [Pseudoxanthomonas suwonensis]KAF1703088.1 hypothetical protein CSC68_05235 [Pseudoxanthomonas suwonensis]